MKIIIACIVFGMLIASFCVGRLEGLKITCDHHNKLLQECTAIAKQRGKERDTYQNELTNSVVMLRKLEGLSFHLHDNDTTLIVADVAPMEGKSLNRICEVLNDIVEFQFKQRKRVHWDLEDPLLPTMTEEEFVKFQQMLREQKQ